MDSFYGGRRGISFILARSFDGIDIPQPNANGEYTYAKVSYAITSTGQILTTTDSNIDGTIATGKNDGKYFIQETSKNHSQYSWKIFPLNGEDIVADNGEFYTLEKKLVQGMKQFFEQGMSTASEVNYGEYVIIDTITNLNNKSSLDNGKVFRRGFEEPEYIGQIVGPQGETPRLTLKSLADINNPIIQKYTAENGKDLVPGYDSENDVFHDEIEYASATIEDEYGNIIGAEIGFKIPYLVQDFSAEIIAPYNVPESVIEEISAEEIHPFYKKFNIKVPHGIHGKDVMNLKLTPTLTKIDIPVYDENYERIVLDNDDVIVDGLIRQEIPVELDKNGNNDFLSIVDYPNYYVRSSDCQNVHLQYIEKDYDNIAEGETTVKDLGFIKDIDRIKQDETGFNIYYNDGNFNHITIVSIEKDSIKLKEDGQLVVKYSGDEEESNIGLVKSVEELYVDKFRFLKVKYNTDDDNLPKDNWTTVGNIEGNFGLRVIGNYENINAIPGKPEDIDGGEKGDCVTIGSGDNTILCYYDYQKNKWMKAGGMGIAGETISKAENVIVLNTDNEEIINQLSDNGFICNVDKIIYAE